jgi:hypothetical protein
MPTDAAGGVAAHPAHMNDHRQADLAARNFDGFGGHDALRFAISKSSNGLNQKTILKNPVILIP